MPERSVHVALIVAVLTTLVVASTTPAGAFDRPTTQVDGLETDSTSLTVNLQSDGDARWAIAYRIKLDTDNETQAFEDFQQDVENDPTPYTDRMETRMQRIADDAENATGREMTVRNVTIETRNQVDYGLVVYRFEWTNFAAVDGDTITAGDAIEGFYLSENRSLQMRWPEGYESDSVTPSATRMETRSVVWEGELTFDQGQPRVVAVPEGQATDGTGADGTTQGPGGDDGGSNVPLLLGSVFAVMVVATAAWLYGRREGVVVPPGTDEDDGGAGVAATDDGEDAAAGPPPELLSNEERVLKLLEQNGGRMKQKQVAEQLDWTAAKTSQVVGDLRDDDELESFRLGRENVLTLPDVELEAGEADESQ